MEHKEPTIIDYHGAAGWDQRTGYGCRGSSRSGDHDIERSSSLFHSGRRVI
jgi:hypothetical protein